MDVFEIYWVDGFLYGIVEVNSKLGKFFIVKVDYFSVIFYLLLVIEVGWKCNDWVGIVDLYYKIVVCYFC